MADDIDSLTTSDSANNPSDDSKTLGKSSFHSGPTEQIVTRSVSEGLKQSLAYASGCEESATSTADLRRANTASHSPNIIKRIWRRFRFGLRTWLILMTLICVVMGNWIVRARTQREACRILTDSGWVWSMTKLPVPTFMPSDEFDPFSDVSTEADQQPTLLEHIDEFLKRGDRIHYWYSVDEIKPDEDSNCNAEVMLAVASLPAVRRLDLSQTKYRLDAESWKALGNARHLEELDLAGTSVDDETIKHIGGLKNLSTLTLKYTKVGSDGLAAIQQLQKLKFLDLSETNVDDRGLKHLANLNSLNVLFVDRTKITSDGIKHLGGLRNLQNLGLDGTLIDDSVVDTLVHFNLYQFSACDTNLTDSGCARIIDACEPIAIYLDGTRVGRATVEAMSKVKQLSIVHLDDTAIEPGDLTLLKNCESISDLQFSQASLADLAALGGLPKLSSDCHWMINFASTKIGVPELRLCDMELDLGGWKQLARSDVLNDLYVRNCNLDDQAALELAKSKSIKTLRVEMCRLTDAGLAHLAGIPTLEKLSIDNAEGITDVSLEAIGRNKKLKELRLQECLRITDAGLRFLTNSDSLKELILIECDQITESGVTDLVLNTTIEFLEFFSDDRSSSVKSDKEKKTELLRAMSTTRHPKQLMWNEVELKTGDRMFAELIEGGRLDWPSDIPMNEQAAKQLRACFLRILDFVGISGEELAVLGELENLEELRLSRFESDEHGIQWLSGLSNRQKLSLQETRLTQKDAIRLSNLNNLKELGLNDVQMETGFFKHLATVGQLESLSLDKTEVSEEDLKTIIRRGKHLKIFSMDNKSLSVEMLEGLLQMPHVDRLSLANCQIDSTKLELIANHGSKFKSLNLANNPVSIEDIRRQLNRFPNLTYIVTDSAHSNFGMTSSTNEDEWTWIRALSGQSHPSLSTFPRLAANFNQSKLEINGALVDDGTFLQIMQKTDRWDRLDAGCSGIGPKSIAELARGDNVRALNLSSTRTADIDCREIGKMTRLRELDLSDCDISDDAVSTLSEGCWRMENLDLSRTGISDQALKSVSRFRYLNYLYLAHTQISDAGLPSLYGLRYLQWIDLSSTKVSPAGLKELKKHLPKATIVSDN